MSPKVVPKGQIVGPNQTSFFHQVKVIGAGLPPAKELATRHPLFAAVIVPGLRERHNVVLDGTGWRSTRHDVEDGLGAHVRNGGAAHMFEVERQGPNLLTDAAGLSDEEFRPASVILDETDDARFETEGVSHR